jgi:hypothetical protein
MSDNDERHRSHLPMPYAQRPTLVVYDAKNSDSRPTPIEQLRDGCVVR